MDGKDRIRILSDLKSGTESLREYEEERGLYYVVVTRVKDELVLFTFVNTFTFLDELLDLKRRTEKR